MNTHSAPDLRIKTKLRAPKLAERLAERIESEVVQAGLPIGTNLGFEPDLIAKYSVSRSVLREAISILERGGLVQMQRGRYGGLTVATTPEDGAVNALQNYFSFVDYLSETKIEKLLFVRQHLEPIALRQAARLVDEEDVAQLRALEAEVHAGTGNTVLNARRILRRLFNTCKNPALIVLIRVLNQLSVIIGLYQNISREELEVYSREILKLRLPQIEALIAGDIHALTSLQFQQIELLRELHQRHRSVRGNSSPAKLDAMRKLVERLYEFTGIDRAVRQSDVVAQFILYEIWRNGWTEGHYLGFEPELVSWIGTTKANFREALRVLERMGLVSMEIGRSGGLVVSAPDPNATLVSAGMCLHALAVTPAQTTDIRQALALASISEVVRDPKLRRSLAAQSLQPLIAATRSDCFDPDYFDQQFRLCIAENSGNQIIALFTQLIARLSTHGARQKSRQPSGSDSKIGLSQFQQIANAISAGDEALARRGMIRVQLVLAAQNE